MGNSFKDSKGREWEPRLALPAIIGLSRECNLSVARIIDFEFRPDHAAAALWWSCEKQARSRNISRDEFEDAIDLAQLRSATLSLWEAVKSAIPEAGALEDKLPKGGNAGEEDFESDPTLPSHSA